MTAKDWVAFSAGRVIAYLGVGFVENAVPAYESEIAPTALRGFISGSLIMLVRLVPSVPHRFPVLVLVLY